MLALPCAGTNVITPHDGTPFSIEAVTEARVVLVSRTGRQQEYVCMSQQVGALTFIAKQDLDASILRQALQG